MTQYRIREICEIVNGATPSTNITEYWNGEIVWITPKDLANLNTRLIFKGHTTITEDGYKSCSTKLVPKGSVLLSSRAPIGYLAIAGIDLCTNQGFKSIICNKQIVNNFYLYYWLSTKTDYLVSISSGSTFKELSREAISDVKINLPDIETQQHIVDNIPTLFHFVISS
ncbi:MAG: restriction endonuclease subunit S [Sphaerochaetaceae bacterium]|nr:restriction endonuclease subunit S [Sphaerochaetaceae bacterium]